MASYNRIILIGNLTRDPQLSYTSSNTAVCKFGLATNEKWKDKDGNMKEDTCFVDCTLFSRQAETFNQYMSKGKPVMIEGRLHLNQWTTPEGEKRSKHEVHVDRFVFLGGGGARGPEGPGRSDEFESAPAAARMSAPAAPRAMVDEPRVPSEADIPF